MTAAGAAAIAVSGIGVLCEDAMSLRELLERDGQELRAARTEPLRPFSRFDPEAHLGKRGHKYLTSATRYALAAAGQALDDAGLRGSLADVADERRGVALGSNFAAAAPTREMDSSLLAGGSQALQPMLAPNFSVNMPASHVAIRNACKAFSVTFTSFVLAGVDAVVAGAQALAADRADVVLAGAVESTPPASAIDLLGGEAVDGAACVFVLERSQRVFDARRPSRLRIGPWLRWFDAPGDAATASADLHAWVAKLEGEERDVRVLRVTAVATENDDALDRVRAALARPGRAVRAERFPIRYASVAPLLALATAAGDREVCVLFASSPLGHNVLIQCEGFAGGHMTDATDPRAERLEEIRRMVADVLELDPTEITDTSRFREDHKADSLRAIEVLARLERTYHVVIPQGELAKMTHLRAVYDIVAARAEW